MKFLSLFLAISLLAPQLSGAQSNVYEECSNLFREEGYKRTANPYKKAFRAGLKQAESLMDRTVAFQAKWPDNVKLIDDVTFKFTHELAEGERPRKMLAISLKNMTAEKEEELLKDYIDYLSWNTISFPLNESAGHLHTRVGKLDLDYFGWFSQNDYRFPSNSRLESFVALTDEEFKNLRQYLHNIDEDVSKVLGESSYDGPTAEIRRATLAKNKPSSGGHNCTSWIATAPIGERKETLQELIGGDGWKIHTNPGWWTAYLQTRGKNHRVPYVAYITREKTLRQINTASKGKVFRWDYGLH